MTHEIRHQDDILTTMRTTVTLDDDVASAIEKLRRDRSIGFSEEVNELIRAGLLGKPPTRAFRQRSRDMGLRIDVTDVAEALDILDEKDQR